jgi:hypothetical protein
MKPSSLCVTSIGLLLFLTVGQRILAARPCGDSGAGSAGQYLGRIDHFHPEHIVLTHLAEQVDAAPSCAVSL